MPGADNSDLCDPRGVSKMWGDPAPIDKIIKSKRNSVAAGLKR